MSQKRKGTAREYRSMRLLEAAGYTVFRMAGSHGLFDLIGISPTDILCIQVKSRDLPGLQAREALEGFKAPANCRKIVYRWRDGQRHPDVIELP
ncbi:MAG: hypothetical protein HYZ81_23465 [Nitrospinae bacterium]|nr:hypothetical protein [Nitrospinota bacterium]